MAERAIQIRQATAALAAKEHSKQLEAALSAAAAESKSKITSLEEDMQKRVQTFTSSVWWKQSHISTRIV